MFLKELSTVTRRLPPNDKSIIEEVIGKINIVASPPPLRIVLSIREDYLGVMEDAAESIPQIFTQRFRLTHLSTESAKIALKEPAQIEDKRIFTRPFEIENDTVKEVINFLKQQIRYMEYNKKTSVEPFQLQLICQKIEDIAIKKQKKTKSKVVIKLSDLGGANGLFNILKEFYNNLIAKIPGMRTRKAVRKLCERELITDSGRRNSVNKEEIMEKFNLSEEI